MADVEILCTGNELLDGSIVDTNSQFVAQTLRSFGLQIGRITVIPDDFSAIVEAVRDSAMRSKFLIVSGGLGPTTDDLTLEAVAASIGRRLIVSKEARRNVLTRLKVLGRKKINSGHKKQMMIPQGAHVLPNAEGTAPGIFLSAFDSQIFFLPGVPREFRWIFNQSIVPRLRRYSKGPGEHLLIFKVFGWAESELNELMKKAPIPSGVTTGYRTHLPENHLKFFVRASSETLARRRLEPLAKWLRAKLGRSLFAEGSESFEDACVKHLLKAKQRIVLAESCSGGLLSSMITSVPGSSAVLDRSFVTYSNDAKIECLSVKPQTLAAHGAVSEEVAKEMVCGALHYSKADIAIAITGIAGPGGGTASKPVGTIWIAAARRGKRSLPASLRTKKLELRFDRHLNQKFSVYEALQLGCELCS